jgi:multicomponent Na+:H+ antiporter subunit B
VLRILASTGVLIYAGTGVVTMLLGGNYLDYDMLSLVPVEGQHIGIMVIELGVGMTVSAVMLMIFFAFAGRGRP